MPISYFVRRICYGILFDVYRYCIFVFGLPVSVITTFVFAYRKKKVLIPAVCIPVTVFLGIAFIMSGGIVYGQTDEYKQSVAEKEQSELEQLRIEVKNQENCIKELESNLEKIDEQEEYIKELESRLETAENLEKTEYIAPVETQEQIETSITTKTPTQEPVPTPEPTYEFTYRKMNVKYLKHEVMVDEINQTVLVVYYEFTNNSEKNQTFDYSFSDTCFQNGIEVEHSYWHANEESKNSGKEIKTGTTITVASSFVLGDSRDDVELEITPFMRDKVLFEKTLELE